MVLLSFNDGLQFCLKREGRKAWKMEDQICGLAHLELWYVVPKIFLPREVFYSAAISLSYRIPEQTHWGNFCSVFLVEACSKKKENLRNSFKSFTVLVNRLEALNWKANAVSFSFCKQNRGKNNASNASVVSNPTVASVWVFRVWWLMGKKVVCKEFRLQASCKQLGETLGNIK